LQKAGYLEEVIEHQGYTENIFRDEDGKLIDIVTRSRDMYKKDSNWANLAYRVTSSNLSENELDIIKAQTESLLAQFLKMYNFSY
jgi:HTH-type transcriptional regulator, competence development regulator